jgi:hypothetical protein
MYKHDNANTLVPKSRYKVVDGKLCIEVRIKVAQQLFDSRDPAPFRDRDLDDDFVEYVVDSARELPRSAPIKLVIYVDAPEAKDLPKKSICDAIYNFFDYQAERQRLDLKSFMSRAQVFLAIGLVILALCLAVSQNIAGVNSLGSFNLLREGVIIFGWVSIWKPIELILYDWYPLYEKLRFYRRLLAADIDVLFPAAV